MSPLSTQNFVPNVSDEEVDALRASGRFDDQWYLSEYPDVALTGIDAARHFLWIGRRLNRKPSADADGAGPGLLSESSARDGEGDKVADATDGTPTAGALAFAARLAGKFVRAESRVDDHTRTVVAKDFDADFYLTNYPDVAEAGVDPVDHYLLNGWLEGRDPSISFSTKYYLDNNPDVAAAGVNPFFHFLAAGKAEGRAGRHQLGFRWDVLSRLKPVADQITELKSYRLPATAGSRANLNAALLRKLADTTRLFLSFSHDDYTRHVGGIQLMLRRELKMMQDRGLLQMHFYPVHPLPFLDTSGDQILLGVLLNGEEIGVFTKDDIVSSLKNAVSTDMHVHFVVHSLLGHNMDQTISILRSAGAEDGFVWIHDYSPLYNNFKLLRNDVEYRGLPKVGTTAWQLCEYARANFSHADEFAKLFTEFNIDLIAPSVAALNIWKQSDLLKPRASHVVSHVELSEVASQPALAQHSKAPLKVGFLGYPADHKGWPVFEELALKMAGDARYEFYHLGKGRRGGVPVAYREVVASEGEPDLMRKAVAAVELDVAMIWSIWPETFCLTAYEAVAGGAALIANPCAGNIVDLIAQTGEGQILDDEAALRDAFESGAIMAYARSRRRVRQFDMNYSAVTLEVLD